jgi:hypothetical protein
MENSFIYGDFVQKQALIDFVSLNNHPDFYVFVKKFISKNYEVVKFDFIALTNALYTIFEVDHMDILRFLTFNSLVFESKLYLPKPFNIKLFYFHICENLEIKNYRTHYDSFIAQLSKFSGF